jgi:hypothetical protein
MGDDMDTLTDNGHVTATSDRVAELEGELRRERLVRENLAARVGALIAENLDLLVRLNEQGAP